MSPISCLRLQQDGFATGPLVPFALVQYDKEELCDRFKNRRN